MYSITALPSDKDDIYQRPCMESGIIPKHPSVVIFSGSTGSGKSNCLMTLLTSPQFYGGENGNKHYFDYIVLIGPTVESDFLYTILKKQNVKIETITHPKPSDIQKILDFQKDKIKTMGMANAPRTLIIYEDIQVHSVGKNSIMRSKPFLETFLGNRHSNLSVFLCSQSYNSTPRSCRMQARGLIYFAGTSSELEVVSREYAPGTLKIKEFQQLINYATKDKHSFLFINKFLGWNTRYRKNFDEIIEINR